MSDDARPVVVWGEGIRAYDFGPGHPLTPKRFGSGIELIRASGADRWMEPREAADEELARLHSRQYIREVRSFSDDPWQPPRRGIASGDVPAFHGMHEAAALVAGGSIEAARAVIAGTATHAFMPAGGLHHAAAGMASGFCIYNDVALAIATARDAGHRVLSLDLDVHHGDGTEALFRDDPEVLTFSIHETGRTLFPGTGTLEDDGGPGAEGTVVNVPLEAGTGDASWIDAVERIVPVLAGLFRPTFLVTQHGCDSHAWDPLAHLELTTNAWIRITRLCDEIAHRWCDGRWVATGGGGYDPYRVVPRSWAIVWHAMAHREVPEMLPEAWHAQWSSAADAKRPFPRMWRDGPEVGRPESELVTERDRDVTDAALALALTRLGAG
ncbi:MAG: acetoin utilization protein AcuC [Chloroflexota bacterium]